MLDSQTAAQTPAANCRTEQGIQICHHSLLSVLTPASLSMRANVALASASNSAEASGKDCVWLRGGGREEVGKMVNWGCLAALLFGTCWDERGEEWLLNGERGSGQDVRHEAAQLTD